MKNETKGFCIAVLPLASVDEQIEKADSLNLKHTLFLEEQDYADATDEALGRMLRKLIEKNET